MDVTDKATDVRKGEALDTAKVEEFLKDSLPGIEGELSISQFPRGFSNLTYLLSVGETEMVLRRPPFGTKAKTAHDMSREYKILTALHTVFPYSPEPLLYCDEPSILGCPFYVMKRIQGIILRKDLPPGMDFSPEQMRRLCEAFVDVQCELHSIDYRKIGLADFGKPEGYIERQVTGWSKRYRAARTPDAPDCEAVMSWLAGNMPPDSNRPGIIHNDFKLDNVVLDANDPTKIVGVLDWEMATIGERLMDLGNTFSYWIQKGDPPQTEVFRQMPTNVEGALTRQELLQRYAEKSGWSIENFDFYYCFGLFRLAVIAQQIYYRFSHGQTTDERFKMLIFVVQMLDQAAIRVVEASDF